MGEEVNVKNAKESVICLRGIGRGNEAWIAPSHTTTKVTTQEDEETQSLHALLGHV